jgi:hypothetical protein
VLFERPTFLDSLESCEGLIALSRGLAARLRRALADAGFPGVPVHAICHPMEMVDNMWTMDKFTRNKDRKIVQVGAWLRDTYAIYALPLHDNALGLRKVALKGKDMDNYFPPAGILKKLHDMLLIPGNATPTTLTRTTSLQALPSVVPLAPFLLALSQQPQPQPQQQQQSPICRGPANKNSHNKYCQGLFTAVKAAQESVSLLEHVDNDAYDDLLAHNLVFLKLVDASAVNTVLECLVRNTVVLVNRHPAVEDVLGKSYPGFYRDLVHASLLLNDLDAIQACHDHLARLDKSPYALDRFVDAVSQAVASSGPFPHSSHRHHRRLPSFIE